MIARRWFVIEALMALFLVSEESIAQETTARFLLLQPSARSMAMGGTGTSLTDNPFGSYYNPAAAVFGPSLALTGSFVKPAPFFGNTIHSYLAAAYRVNAANAVSVSANLYHRSAQEWESYDGSAGTPGTTSTSWEGKVTFSHILNDRMALGASGALLRLNLLGSPAFFSPGNENPTGWLFDVGFLARNLATGATLWSEPSPSGERSLGSHSVEPGFSVGIAILNIGTNVSQIDPAQSDNLPGLISLGTAYSPVCTGFASLLIALDAQREIHTASSLDYVRFGTEVTFLRLISFRAGYAGNTSDLGKSYGTFGFGLDYWFFHVNIANYNNTLEPTWHFDSTLGWEL